MLEGLGSVEKGKIIWLDCGQWPGVRLDYRPGKPERLTEELRTPPNLWELYPAISGSALGSYFSCSFRDLKADGGHGGLHLQMALVFQLPVSTVTGCL